MIHLQPFQRFRIKRSQRLGSTPVKGRASFQQFWRRRAASAAHGDSPPRSWWRRRARSTSDFTRLLAVGCRMFSAVAGRAMPMPGASRITPSATAEPRRVHLFSTCWRCVLTALKIAGTAAARRAAASRDRGAMAAPGSLDCTHGRIILFVRRHLRSALALSCEPTCEGRASDAAAICAFLTARPSI